MKRPRDVAAVKDWKKILWWALGCAILVAGILVWLSSVFQIMYLVGLAFGLALAVLALFLAHWALRVELGEPSGTLDENGFAFLFQGANRYPQCLLFGIVGLVTMAAAPTVALLAGTAGFSAVAQVQHIPEGNRPGPDPIGKPQPPPEDQGSAAPGLRAAWAFDEGQGDRAVSTGPQQPAAKLHGCQWVPGVRGTAVQFNGTTDYLELPTVGVLNFADNAPFTIAFWVKTVRDKGYLLSFRHQPDTCDLLNVFLSEGRLAVWVRQRDDPFVPDTTLSKTTIHDGQWHHCAVTRQAGGEVTLYLDGVLQGKLVTPQRARGRLVTNRRTLGMEAYNLPGAPGGVERARLEGCLDEFCVFGQALAEAEIRKLLVRN